MVQNTRSWSGRSDFHFRVFRFQMLQKHSDAFEIFGPWSLSRWFHIRYAPSAAFQREWKANDVLPNCEWIVTFTKIVILFKCVFLIGNFYEMCHTLRFSVIIYQFSESVIAWELVIVWLIVREDYELLSPILDCLVFPHVRLKSKHLVKSYQVFNISYPWAPRWASPTLVKTHIPSFESDMYQNDFYIKLYMCMSWAFGVTCWYYNWC